MVVKSSTFCSNGLRPKPGNCKFVKGQSSCTDLPTWISELAARTTSSVSKLKATLTVSRQIERIVFSDDVSYLRPRLCLPCRRNPTRSHVVRQALWADPRTWGTYSWSLLGLILGSLRSYDCAVISVPQAHSYLIHAWDRSAQPPIPRLIVGPELPRTSSLATLDDIHTAGSQTIRPTTNARVIPAIEEHVLLPALCHNATRAHGCITSKARQGGAERKHAVRCSLHISPAILLKVYAATEQ